MSARVVASAEAALGAVPLPDGRTLFRVWAPLHERISVRLLGPPERVVELEPRELGYHEATVGGVGRDGRYLFCLPDGSELPDPASRLQPEGVHGPSQVVDPSLFAWRADEASFAAPALEDSVFYELHVGTFSAAGTFAGAAQRLDHLARLGVTTVEIMPVSAFPGDRNWGYDGVFPWAVQESYGGPRGLAQFVDACHARGLAVALDVVYNHLGPEGNYLGRFAPYFNDRYRTPWGPAVNFDGADSDEVRRYFIASALYFFRAYRIDVFRLDAVHAILDTTARPFLEDFSAALHAAAAASGRRVVVIGESSLNDPRLIRPVEQGGLGLDGQWSDDFHHAVHVLATGERQGYYADFEGPRDLVTAYRAGFVYQGQRSSFLRRAHGRVAGDRSPRQLVVCTQNHDQVGNRARGDRLAEHLSAAQQRALAGLLLLGPATPLLFMGQEWGETAPFAFFTSHGDEALVEAVRVGRVEEFAGFGWRPADIPDPQDPATFERSRLDWSRAAQPHGEALVALHRALLALRATHPAMGGTRFGDADARIVEEGHGLVLERRSREARLVAFFAIGDRELALAAPEPPSALTVLLDSEDGAFGGSGARALRTTSSSGTEIPLAPWSFRVVEVAAAG